MAQSILTSIKKTLGVAESETAFDVDITLHINSVLSILTQLGIGPTQGFMIEDATTTWDALLEDDLALSMAKTYVYLKVKLLFDPPQTSFVIESMDRNIAEIENRISIHREGKLWATTSS